MLVGEYELRIDHKGRIAIPAKLRQSFGGGLVVSRGFDKCLLVYTMEEWGKVAKRLASTSPTHLNSRRTARLVFSGAFDLVPDRQGRVVLPPILRQYAGIGDQVVLIGAYTHLEIWSKQLWENEKQFVIENAAQISEAVEM